MKPEICPERSIAFSSRVTRTFAGPASLFLTISCSFSFFTVADTTLPLM